MKAWIIRWEWMGNHAAHHNPFIAVVSARSGVKDVRRFIERFYMVATASPNEQLEYARYRNPRTIAYRAEVSANGIIHCGQNPFIVGRRAERVRLTDDGFLTWIEGGKELSLMMESATL